LTKTVDWLFYSCPEDAPAGFPTVFTDRFWDDREHWIPPGVGVVPGSMRPYFGPIPTWELKPLRGTADEWANGVSYARYIAGEYHQLNGCAPIQPIGVSSRLHQGQALLSLPIPPRLYAVLDQVQEFSGTFVVLDGLNSVQGFTGYVQGFTGVDQLQELHSVIPLGGPLDQIQDFSGTLVDTSRSDQVQSLQGTGTVTDMVCSLYTPWTPISMQLIGTGGLAPFTGFHVMLRGLHGYGTTLTIPPRFPRLSITLDCGLNTPGIWGLWVNDFDPFTHLVKVDSDYSQNSPYVITFPTIPSPWPWAPGDTLRVIFRYP
jgi:hypothetical protein